MRLPAKRSGISPSPSPVWHRGYTSGGPGMPFSSWDSHLRPLLPKAQMQLPEFCCNALLKNDIHLGIKGHHLVIPGSTK